MLEEGERKGSEGVRLVGPGGGGGERGGKGKSRKRKGENEREREMRGGGFTSIYAAVTRGARKERGRGERKRGKRASRSESTILHHWRPFWTTQVAVRA